MLLGDVQPARLFVFSDGRRNVRLCTPYCPKIKPLECVAQAAQMLYKTGVVFVILIEK